MAVEQHFKEKFHVIFGRLATPGKQPTDDDMRSLMFGDYMINSRDAVKTYYDEIKDLNELREVFLLFCLNTMINVITSGDGMNSLLVTAVNFYTLL